MNTHFCNKTQTNRMGQCCDCHCGPAVPSSDFTGLLSGVINDLEYAAFNLCEKTDDDVHPGVVESTCPEVTLFLAIRKLKQVAR